nr:hypothetical protein [Sicyoidochytrium minutum DNA virus]
MKERPVEYKRVGKNHKPKLTEKERARLRRKWAAHDAMHRDELLSDKYRGVPPIHYRIGDIVLAVLLGLATLGLSIGAVYLPPDNRTRPRFEPIDWVLEGFQPLMQKKKYDDWLKEKEEEIRKKIEMEKTLPHASSRQLLKRWEDLRDKSVL